MHRSISIAFSCVVIFAAVTAASCSDVRDQPAAKPPPAVPAPAPVTPPPASTPAPRVSVPAPQSQSQSQGRADAPSAALKIDSQVLAEINRAQGKPAPPDKTGVKIDEKQRALVDLRADPTDELRKSVETAGGTIVSTSARDHSVIAWIPLLAIERVAADPAVRFVVPAAQAILQAQAPLGRELELRVGQVLTIGDEPITVRFEGVTADSRCPANVTCVWAGDAVVRLLVSGAREARATLELHTKDAPDQVAPFASYRIRLVKLLPARLDTNAIPADQYVATVIVTKNP